MRPRITLTTTVTATVAAIALGAAPAGAAPGADLASSVPASAAWSEPVLVAPGMRGVAGLETAPDGYATAAFSRSDPAIWPRTWTSYERRPGGEWTSRSTSWSDLGATEFSDSGEGWQALPSLQGGHGQPGGLSIRHRPPGGAFEGPFTFVRPVVDEGDTWVRSVFLLSRGRTTPTVLGTSRTPAGRYRTALLLGDSHGGWSAQRELQPTDGDPAFHVDSTGRIRVAWVRTTAAGQALVTATLDSEFARSDERVTPLTIPAPVAPSDGARNAVTWAGDATMLLWLDREQTRAVAVTEGGADRRVRTTDLGSVLPGTGGVHSAASPTAGHDSLVWVAADHALMRATVRAGRAPRLSQVATGVRYADVAADRRGNTLVAWLAGAGGRVRYLLDWVGAGQSRPRTMPALTGVRTDLAVGVLDDDTFTLLTGDGHAADLAIPVALTQVRAVSPRRWLSGTRATYRARTAWLAATSYDVRARVSRPTSRTRRVERLPGTTQAGSFRARPGATYCLQARSRGVAGPGDAPATGPWGDVARCVTAPYPPRRMQHSGPWRHEPGALVTRERGASLTWRGMRAARQVVLRVRPTAGRVTVTLGGQVVGTKRLDRRLVRVGALTRPVRQGKLVVEVRSLGRPVRIQSVYVTR